ncbi:hypothetical protein [Trebonia sp.]|uniref:hypothetical protein n=1 Tax=Trebonia sp. TaxID=2767075 RepID=UPI00261F1E3B|nr:hypothetical protein [Trebonia sp.]
MDADTIFLDCPAYTDPRGTARCGLPAAVEDRYRLGSTDGAVTGVRIRCPRGHWFSGPVDALTTHAAPAPDTAADALRARVAARVSSH